MTYAAPESNAARRPTAQSGAAAGFGRALAAAMLGMVLLASGCADPRGQNGRIWYVDGVGNWGYGVDTVPRGLYGAGYPGVVDNFRWSVTLNPLLDQTLRIFARSGGARLSGIVAEQLRRYPNAPVDLIGLSAGTGVVVWAIEDLKPPMKVRHAVLLGSSLSNRYDLRRAIANMTGDIFVYYSPRDPVLDGPARLVGTIDGQFDSSAGLTGFRGPGSTGGRVKNIPWRGEYARLGWTGNHTDCTAAPFIQRVVAPNIVGSAAAAKPANRS